MKTNSTYAFATGLSLCTMLFLFAGCSSDADLTEVGDKQTTPDRQADATTPAIPPNETGKDSDLSVPLIEPKPLVWSEDYEAGDSDDTISREARLQSMFADRLKSMERFDEAETRYRKAMELEPEWSYPPYQLACNYELSGQKTKALAEFQTALKLGFADFPTALGDDELGSIRERDEFKQELMSIKQRYIKSAKANVGTPVAFKPTSEKPDQGWPIMLLLHGYGDTNESYFDSAKAWQKLGYLTVAIPGSVPASPGRFMWSNDSIDPTHRDLQKVLGSPLIKQLYNPAKVYLLGFSQGALHAMLLTQRHSDLYAGVVGISPGGSLSRQLGAPHLSSENPSSCFFIHGSQEGHAPYVKVWAKACSDAGWRFASSVHPGGHHFPDNWEQERPKVAEFLLKE